MFSCTLFPRFGSAVLAALLWLAPGVQAQPASQTANTPPAANTCPAPWQPPTPEQRQAAEREAKDRGFLWRLEKDGKTSHLYGTVHVGRLEWVFPGPALARALQASAVLAMELDVSDSKVQRELMAPHPPCPCPATGLD